jgi:hypothetical protein
MEFSGVLAAAILVVLAIAHSYLGEKDVIRPLLSAEWQIEGLPRWAADRLLRFVWHLATVAWLGFAGIMLDWPPFMMVALATGATALLIVLLLPAHGAWPLFAIAAAAAWWMDGSLTTGVLRAAAMATAAVLVIAGLVHVYWAFGGRWMWDRVFPTHRDGRELKAPGRWLTLAVAVLIAGFGSLVAVAATDTSPTVVRWLVACGALVLAIRAIGDGKVSGFTKSERSTAFGRADDRIFTPLVVLLAMGSVGALLVGI